MSEPRTPSRLSACPVCRGSADGEGGYCRAHTPLTEEPYLNLALETLAKLCSQCSIITAFTRGQPRIYVVPDSIDVPAKVVGVPK